MIPPCRVAARPLLLAAILLAAAAPGSARAAPLGFTGTLTLFLLPANYGPVPISGGGIAQVTGSPNLTSFTIPLGAFGPFTTAISNYFGTAGDLRLTSVENRSGAFAGSGGTMGLNGIAKICLVFDPSCTVAFVPLPIGATGTPAVGFGIGGTQTLTGGVKLTAQHAPWGLAAPFITIHDSASAVTTPTFPAGFVHGPASGSLSTAALPSGVVQLVTASKAFTSLTAAFPEIHYYAVLNLHFVPEPGTFALLAAAAGAILVAAPRRR